MKTNMTPVAVLILIAALCANSAFGQLTLDSFSPTEGFAVFVSEGSTQEFSVVVSGSATPTYTWLVNGTEQDQENDVSFILAPGLDFVQERFNGDQLGLQCTISAGGVEVTASWTVTVQDTNHLPSIGSILLQESPQERASRFSDLEVYVREGAPSDPDPEDSSLRYVFTWTNGIETIVDGPKFESSSTLNNAAHVGAGETWHCTLQVQDELGGLSEDSITSPDIVINNLPTTGTPELSFDYPFTLPDLSFNYAAEIRALPDNVIDADDEDQLFLSYRYQWYVDGSPVSLGDYDDLPLDTGLAFPGSEVYLEVIPQDSFDEGIAGRSRTVVLGKLFELSYETAGSAEKVHFGFFEEASEGQDQYDGFGMGVYLSILDTPDPNVASHFGRAVVPLSADHVFSLFGYDSGQELNMSWQDSPFFESSVYMYEVSAKGRVIGNEVWNLNQPGSVTLPSLDRERLFEIRVIDSSRNLQFQKLLSGWNLVSPAQVLESSKIADATGFGGSLFGFQWDAGVLEPTEDFALLKGCWVYNKHNTGFLQLLGLPANESTLSLEPGWNLIGVTRNIAAPDDSRFLSPFWGWSGSFRIAEQLVPGQGYWVNVSEAVDLPLVP
jgi:hypothetical protein